MDAYKLMSAPNPSSSAPIAWRHGLLTFDAVSVLMTTTLISVAWLLAMLYCLPEFWRFIVPLILLSIFSMADWLRPLPGSFCLSYWCNMVACFFIFLFSTALIACALFACDGNYKYYIEGLFVSKVHDQILQLLVKMARGCLLYVALLQMIISYVCLAAYQHIRRQANSVMPR